MNGRILVGDHRGVYMIRFEGDVRVTLSRSFDHYLDALLKDENLVAVLVDLCDAKAIDSTSLGVLAKLSIAVQQGRGKLPTLVCDEPDILRILHNMGFDDVFAIVNDEYQASHNLAELPVAADLDEASLRSQVIEAHKTLMDMNQHNHDTFKDLVGALESESREQPAEQTQSTQQAAQHAAQKSAQKSAQNGVR